MENAGQIRWIAGYQPQRAFVIKSLETIEQLPGDFQVWFHSKPHVHQFIHLFWPANRERCWSDAGQGKTRLGDCALGGVELSLPTGQTVNRAPFEILVVGDGPNHPGKTTTALDEIELLSLAGLVRRERTSNARCIARWV